MKNWLNKALDTLLFTLPVVVFFTNFPLIRLGENSSMYFEISLPMIWLAVFDLLSLTRVKQIFALCRTHQKICLPILGLLIYLALSCIWSANPLRGFLTAGLVFAIAFALFSIFSVPIPTKQRRCLLVVYLFASSAVSFFCLIQGFLDIFGIQQSLLCLGCHYQTIGFPHSNGFAIEPQFMGNLLIAPCLITLDLIYKQSKTKKRKRKLPLLLCLAFLQILALFVTFSRGAIFAFMLGVIILTIYRALKKLDLRAFCYLGISVFACLSGLLLQGLWAEISPTSEGFLEGISRSINHLSLGTIDFLKSIPENTTIKESTAPQSDFDGYIEESSTIRLSLNEIAIKTWYQNPKNIIVGVGLGGAGQAMHQYSNINEREIVQNEYISLLLELGIAGCTLVLLAGFSIFRYSHKKCPPAIVAIFVAYLFTLLFFSGLTNVWHIYLLAPLLIPILEHQTRMLK